MKRRGVHSIFPRLQQVMVKMPSYLQMEQFSKYQRKRWLCIDLVSIMVCGQKTAGDFWAGTRCYAETLEFLSSKIHMPVGINVSAPVLCAHMCVCVCHTGYLFVSACNEERRCVVCVCVWVKLLLMWVITPFFSPGAIRQERTEGEELDWGFGGRGGDGDGKHGGCCGGDEKEVEDEIVCWGGGVPKE